MPSAYRYMRDAAVLAKNQTAAGVDAVPTGAANAMLISNLDITPVKADMVDRALMVPWFGASEQLIASISREISFEVEYTAHLTPGTAPSYDALLQSLGLAGVTAATPARYEYSTISTGIKFCTLYVYGAGVQYKYLDCLFDVELSLGVNGKPVWKFKGIGKDGVDLAVTTPALTLTTFQAPQVITDSFSGDVIIGGTYAAAALTGGTAYPGQGIDSVKFGNKLQFTPGLGGDSVDIVDRSVEGTMTLDITAAQEVTLLASARNPSTLQSIGFQHGTAAGSRSILFMPTCQIINPKRKDVNGKLMWQFDFRSRPVTSGADFLWVTY